MPTQNRSPLLYKDVHKHLLATASDDSCKDTQTVRELKETKLSSLLDGSLSEALGVLARLQNALARLFPSNTVLLDVCLALVGLQLDETHAKWQYALEKQPMARLRRYRLSLSTAKAEMEKPSSGKLPFFTAGNTATARELLATQKEKITAMPMREAWPEIVRLHNAMQSAFSFKLVPLDVCMGLLGLEVHAEGCEWACPLDDPGEVFCSDDEDEGESLGDESEDVDDDDDEDEDYKNKDDDDEEAEDEEAEDDEEADENDATEQENEDDEAGDSEEDTQSASPPKRKAARPAARAAGGAKKQKK